MITPLLNPTPYLPTLPFLLTQHQQKSRFNISSTLARFEFVEALVRTAKKKYCSVKSRAGQHKNPHKQKTLAEGTRLTETSFK